MSALIEAFICLAELEFKGRKFTDAMQTEWTRRDHAADFQRMGLHCAPDGAATYLWTPFWHGIAGGLPGFATGTQSVESFHRSWKTMMAGAGPAADLTRLLPQMDEAFQKWGERESWLRGDGRLGIEPRGINPDLLDGDKLKKSNRHPATKFWEHRS